ncbi:hypothetical protein BGX20_004556, partial [Mortierella sp. AD010]
MVSFPTALTHCRSNTLTFLDEFPCLETLSISDIEIAPKALLMFENLVSRMSHLTTLSTHSIGTINLLSSIQQWCPNLTSFVLDMSAIYYPSGPVDDLNSRQKQMCELWILLFKTLPSLGRFIRTDISMPMVVLDAL